ncbi:unnamed protein product [Nesidiocoris tenuis]|uniref:Cytochrome P450 n=1 Tax=Nesidiocoris tenuis TaxID=355587 RepID=A0A6H5HC24_9HEMI|nr:unnamed protein product [Nesidiocoris tenuis]
MGKNSTTSTLRIEQFRSTILISTADRSAKFCKTSSWRRRLKRRQWRLEAHKWTNYTSSPRSINYKLLENGLLLAWQEVMRGKMIRANRLTRVLCSRTGFFVSFDILSKLVGKLLYISNPQLLARLGESDQDDDLNWLLTDVAIRVRKNINCLLVITDNLYHGLLKVAFLQTFRKIPIFLKNFNLFWDKTADLRGELLKVATFEHMPSVVKNHRSEITEDDYMVLGTDDKPVKYDGLEIQVIYDAEAAIANVAAGHYAYYENIHYLHHAKVKEKLAEAAMKDNATALKRARMLLEIGLLAIAAWLLWKALAPDAETVKLGNAIPGPDSLPVIGNLFNIPLTGKAAMDCQAEWEKKYGSVVRLWMGNLLVVQLFNPDDVEVLLKSTTQIKKAKLYEFVHPWLGTGLLTSTGPKWRMRRKAITPTFHFKILEDFIDIFNRNGNIFVDCLKSKIGQGSFDVLPYVTAYTMDIICETAMGTQIGAQAGNNVDYRNAVIRKKEKESQNQKTDSDGIQTDEFGERMLVIEVLTRTKSVPLGWHLIERHRLEKITIIIIPIIEVCTYLGIKKKSAFLELLIQMRKEANPAFQTDEDVREEVDTFMFEGHDTTTAGICFALDCLAGYPQYQVLIKIVLHTPPSVCSFLYKTDKIYEELKVKYSAADCNPTMDEINEFKYLDMFLKEVLRLCPSVPNIARQLTEPLQLASGYILPAGCLAVVNFYLLHRNKIHWPTPEVFDPENFAPETSRHPFAYVPFSAGPRNCIGQKFAILEMKLTLIKLIVNFKIERDPSHEVIRDCHLVLQSLNGHKMKFSKRE